MPPCPKENESQHYRQWRGFGPVKDDECLVFVVFETTPRDISEGKLIQNSFDNNNLKKGILSFARSGYITTSEFERRIIAPALSKKGKFVGVAWVSVLVLRSLLCEFTLNDASTARVRGLCILDLVEKGDVDGHATAGYCQDVPSGVGQEQLGRRRAKLRLNMAASFSTIASIDSLEWPSLMRVLVERISYLLRRMYAAIRDLIHD
jgi:hypothetical protein